MTEDDWDDFYGKRILTEGDLTNVENMIEFIIKENLRLGTRITNLCAVLSDHLGFTDMEEDSLLNPNINYEEEKKIIRGLHYETKVNESHG